MVYTRTESLGYVEKCLLRNDLYWRTIVSAQQSYVCFFRFTFTENEEIRAHSLAP